VTTLDNPEIIRELDNNSSEYQEFLSKVAQVTGKNLEIRLQDEKGACIM
jgi:hypothetical protein